MRFYWLGAVLLLACLAASVAITWPLLSLWQYRVESEKVQVIPAAADARPVQVLKDQLVRAPAAGDYLRRYSFDQYSLALDDFSGDLSDVAVLAIGTGAEPRTFVYGVDVRHSLSEGGGDWLLMEGAGPLRHPGPDIFVMTSRFCEGCARPDPIAAGPAEELTGAATRFEAYDKHKDWPLILLGSVIAIAGGVGGLLSRRILTVPVALCAALTGALLTHWLRAKGFSPLPLWGSQSALLTISAVSLVLLVNGERESWRPIETWLFRSVLGGAVFTLPTLALQFTPGASVPGLAFSLAVSAIVATLAGSWTVWSISRSELQDIASRPSLRLSLWLVAWGIIALGLFQPIALSAWWTIPGGAFARICLLAAGLILVGSSAIAGFDRIEALVRARLGLHGRLAEQQREIAEQRRRLEQEIGQRVQFEERNRVAREIHDGLGGNLTSLLMRVRTGAIPPQDIESEIEDALLDMRHVILVLEEEEPRLDTELSTIRARLAAKFEAMGIAFAWHETGSIEDWRGSSEHVLHIVRIVQEASSNVLRHAAPTRVSISIDLDVAGRLAISIINDGANAAAEGGGHGIANMARRAKLVGGTIEIVPDADLQTWKVLLLVPPGEAADDQSDPPK